MIDMGFQTPRLGPFRPADKPHRCVACQVVDRAEGSDWCEGCLTERRGA